MNVMPANSADTEQPKSPTESQSTPARTPESVTEVEAANAAAPGSTAAPDDVRERFRAALEHKRAGGPGADGAHGGGKTGTATTNSKVQRTFRRRAGG